MADIFDRAQEADEQFRQMSIDAVKRQAAQHRLNKAASRTTCAWCLVEIPLARREAVPGCDLCAGCQDQKEHLKERP